MVIVVWVAGVCSQLTNEVVCSLVVSPWKVLLERGVGRVGISEILWPTGFAFSEAVGYVIKFCENRVLITPFQMWHWSYLKKLNGLLSVIIGFVLFQIYVEFGSADDSKNAAQSLAGRKFANRVVVTSFYSPEMFHRKEFHWYARSYYEVFPTIESSKARNLSSVPFGAIVLEFLWNSFFVYWIFSLVYGSYSNEQANIKIGLGVFKSSPCILAWNSFCHWLCFREKKKLL